MISPAAPPAPTFAPSGAPASAPQHAAPSGTDARRAVAPSAHGQQQHTLADSVHGQLFGAGMSFAFATAFVVSGLGMVFGADALQAAAWGMVCFVVIGVAGWIAEMCLAPALERIATERRRAQEEAARGPLPAPADPPAIAGAAGAPGAGGALDVTLPEEGAAGEPVADPSAPAATGLSAAGNAGNFGGTPAPGIPPSSGTPFAGTAGTLGPPQGRTPAAEEFQELSSLLRRGNDAPTP